MKVINIQNSIEFYKGETLTCVIIYNNWIEFFNNGKFHNKNGAARIFYKFNYKVFYYNGYSYGHNTFTNKTWKTKIKKLKREEKLKIFK